MEIAFTIPAIPIAQPRQRTRTIRTEDGREFVSHYTPTKHPVNAFKAATQLAVAKQMGERGVQKPFAGPVTLHVEFFLPRPGNMRWKKKPMARARHTKKPDLDNLLKSLKDALSGLLWNDDAQVYSVDAAKFIAGGEESPHCYVSAMEIEE